jgi:hypothetical protein
METEKKIEFYKKRSVGEVLSVSADFLLQNWKVMYKNILIIGGPLACLQGIFLHNYSSITRNFALMQTGFSTSFFVNIILFFVISLLVSIFLYSITATFLNQYGEEKLTKDTQWIDLKKDVYCNARKTFLILLCVSFISFIIGLALYFLTGKIIAGIGLFSPAITGLLVLIYIGLLIPFLPGLSLVFFPAYFHDEAAVISFTKGFSLGFRHWGSTFLVLLVTVVIAAVFSFIMEGAYLIWTFFGLMLPLGIVGTIISYILAIIASFATVIATPVTLTILSFQYFSIIEDEEGVSIQSGVDEFDKL